MQKFRVLLALEQLVIQDNDQGGNSAGSNSGKVRDIADDIS